MPPDSVNSPRRFCAIAKLYEQLNSAPLGFSSPDFGSTAHQSFSGVFTNYFRKLAIPENIIELGEQVWLEPSDPTDPHSKIKTFHERAKAIGGRETDIAEMFHDLRLVSGHQGPIRMAGAHVPKSYTFMGSFYDFDEKWKRICHPLREDPACLREGRLRRVYVKRVGRALLQWTNHGFPKVQAHQALCKRILGRVLAVQVP